MRIIKFLRDEASRRSLNIFLVGGAVRDLIMGSKNLDLDILVEGDAIAFGEHLAKETGCGIVSHKRFGTCTIDMSGKIDLASARKETYARPAALPEVSFSGVREDLARRDFTINAMALSLNPKDFGRIIDFYNGREDIKKGRIRVLHDASFIDDPTRILRAVRFEQRYGFRIEPHTMRLLRGAARKQMAQRTEKQRLRDELILILKEDYPGRAVKRLADLQGLSFMHPRLRFSKKTERLFASVRKVVRRHEKSFGRKDALNAPLMYLAALLEALDPAQIRSVGDSFAFRRRDIEQAVFFREKGAHIRKTLRATKKIKPHMIHELLSPLSREVTLLIMAAASSETARGRIRRFLARHDGAALKIGGSDLKNMGLKEGPGFGEILAGTLRAKIDGRLKTKADELRFARKLIANKMHD
ncbi:MAG: hypothetical protein ABH825_00480 [Candidatus Omnitrophota bacterium]